MSNDTDDKILSGMGIPPLEECSVNSDETPYGGIKVNLRTDGNAFSHVNYNSGIESITGPRYADIQECAERFEHLLDYLHGHRESMNKAEMEGFLREWNEIKHILNMTSMINKLEYIEIINMLFIYLCDHYEDITEAEMEDLVRKVERAFVGYLSYL